MADSHYKPHIAASENADGSYTVSLDSLGKDMRYSLDGGPAQPYQGPFRVAGSARIRAHTVLGEGETIGDARLTVVDHLARGAEVRPAEPSGEWTAGKGTVLVDGLLATDRIFRYPEWHTFGPQGMDLVLHLEAPARLSQVSIGWQAGFHRQLFRPTSASVQVPGPEGVWITVAELDSQTIAASDGNRLLLEFAPVTAGRVRVTAQTEDTHWSEEQSREIPSTLRVDEIIVR